MAASKKTANSKSMPKDIDFVNQSQILKKTSKSKNKIEKRQPAEQFEEEEMARLIGQYQASKKKKKHETNVEDITDFRQKILDFSSHQLEAWNQCRDNISKMLEGVTTQVEEDYNTMKRNEEKLKLITDSYMKLIRQATAAYENKLKLLNDIRSSFQKNFQEIESNCNAEMDTFVNDIDDDFKKLLDQVVIESKRNHLETLRQSIFHVMQNMQK